MEVIAKKRKFYSIFAPGLISLSTVSRAVFPLSMAARSIPSLLTFLISIGLRLARMTIFLLIRSFGSYWGRIPAIIWRGVFSPIYTFNLTNFSEFLILSASIISPTRMSILANYSIDFFSSVVTASFSL